jgi:hypothetical protein
VLLTQVGKTIEPNKDIRFMLHLISWNKAIVNHILISKNQVLSIDENHHPACRSCEDCLFPWAFHLLDTSAKKAHFIAPNSKDKINYYSKKMAGNDQIAIMNQMKRRPALGRSWQFTPYLIRIFQSCFTQYEEVFSELFPTLCCAKQE